MLHDAGVYCIGPFYKLHVRDVRELNQVLGPKLLLQPEKNKEDDLGRLRRHQHWRTVHDRVQVFKSTFCTWSHFPVFFWHAYFVPDCGRLFLRGLLGGQDVAGVFCETASKL